EEQLPAALERDRVLLGELVHELGALDAELGLERAWRIVNARVDDAGVMAGLVLRHRAGLVDDDDLGARPPGDYFARDGEPHDPGADHGHVIAVRSHPDIVLLGRATGGQGREQLVADVRGCDSGDLRMVVARRDLYDVGADQVEAGERPEHAEQFPARQAARFWGAGTWRVRRVEHV